MAVGQRRLVAIFLVAAALLVGGSSSAHGSYKVEGGHLTLVLSGQPSEHRHVKFHLVREGTTNEHIYFSLSDVKDNQGNQFPRDLIRLSTDYDSEELSWDNEYSKHCLLQGGDSDVELELGVYYAKAIPAGTYTGYLYSGVGDDIPLEIVVKAFTDIVVNPEWVAIEALSGPGSYKAKEPVEVIVTANHTNWVVTISSQGLIFQDSQKEDWQSSEQQIIPVPISFVDPHEENIRRESLQFMGGDYGGDGVIQFEIEAQIGWEHPAGTYVGVVSVDVNTSE
jgi:hypothetical protein